MEFLRRLAPSSIAGDLSRAMPLLASRFAGEAPLRSVAGAADGEPASIGSAPVDAGVSPRAVAARPVVVSRAATTAAREVVQSTRERGGDAPHGESPAGPQPQPIHAAIAPQHAFERLLAERADAVAFAAPMPRLAQPSAAPVPQPLAQRTLDARLAVTAPVPGRPVVHVTIDRIDVRVPAAPPRAAEAARPRRDTPSVPLADYLRGKVGP